MLLLPAILMFNIFRMPSVVHARFCEGGHYCSLPRECCTQGCCPPYQSGPRQLPPPSDHVLNLFFISHWFFWCVVVAIILALLCAYSLWKRRRTLCGWGFTDHRAQSEGDSAGSCYAPPQYSRCNSFHHPPPPYTEVTSKPDLYPLVFTCNSDNTKTGSSYLMVQYFRNYIVRPIGSLSAASTVDSLSSSFICNINEANTLVPPPYSRAASPETGFSSHFQHDFLIPRSASQLVYGSGNNGCNNNVGMHDINSGIVTQQIFQQNRAPHFTVVARNGSVSGNQNGIDIEDKKNSTTPYSTILQTSIGEHFNLNEKSAVNNTNPRDDNGYGSGTRSNRSSGGASNFSGGCIPKGCIQSQSEQQFRYFNNSSSSISDIFINNNRVDRFDNGSNGNGSKSFEVINLDETEVKPQLALPVGLKGFSTQVQPNKHETTVVVNNGFIKSNQLHHTSTFPTQLLINTSILNPTYKSCDSIVGVNGPTSDLSETELKDLNLLRQSLETCYHLLEKQQPQTSINNTESPLCHVNKILNKYTKDDLSNYTTSDNCSDVSSLANACIPSSPPQATSPTGEVKDILNQIRQWQEEISYEDLLLHMKPALCHTLSSPSNPTADMNKSSNTYTQRKVQRNSVACCEIQPNSSVICPNYQKFSKTTVHLATSSLDKAKTTITAKAHNTQRSPSDTDNLLKRPSTLHQNKIKHFIPKSNKALYIPMIPNDTLSNSSKYTLKSPVNSIVGTKFFASKGGKMRKIFISRSAPSTPGTALPLKSISDDSPLLTEHDEDPETDQNENIQ
ncbi:uncharacterized protein DDB_G0292186 [Zeugodacus cucurbitae]|uniref:uncharacterized protein DDB_G0292186 n=1 Tax=Zeugodacus cucurbitae TaxID=28588 RepID=UPI0023D93916|nr:uncharacterized protein DDB_G0292186 [Zeugodacus cucurbitae]